MQRKSLLKSKTFWANVIVGAVGVATALMDSPMIAENPEVLAYFATGVSVLNVFLRLITSDEVTVTGN